MTCDRLERDDLLGHLGEEMDPHVEQCHACRATSYAYTRLTAALAEESDRALPAGWKERTLARIHAEQTARRWRNAAKVGCSLAAAAAVILVLVLPGKDPPPEALTILIEPGAGRRGAAAARANQGDILRASSPARGKNAELRIYREPDAMIVRCPGAPEPACRRVVDGLEAMWVLDPAGVYRAVWLESTRPLPSPSGDIDADLAQAERAGARVQESDPIHVH